MTQAANKGECKAEIFGVKAAGLFNVFNVVVFSGNTKKAIIKRESCGGGKLVLFVVAADTSAIFYLKDFNKAFCLGEVFTVVFGATADPLQCILEVVKNLVQDFFAVGYNFCF